MPFKGNKINYIDQKYFYSDEIHKLTVYLKMSAV